jgi:hypothetical protein
MPLYELASVLTHAPLFLVFRVIIKRLYCTTLLLINITLTFMASASYHLCKLINDTPCFFPLATEQLIDHIAAENAIISVSLYFAPFRKEWHRAVVNLLATAGLIIYKCYSDTFYYMLPVSFIAASTGVRYYYRYREFQMMIGWGIVAFVFYFAEGNEENAINQFYHSSWHLCVFMALYYAIAARRYRPDSEDCKCKIPVKYGAKIDENPTDSVQRSQLFPEWDDHYIGQNVLPVTSGQQLSNKLVTINGKQVRYIYDPLFSIYGNFTKEVEVPHKAGVMKYKLNMVA